MMEKIFTCISNKILSGKELLPRELFESIQTSFEKEDWTTVCYDDMSIICNIKTQTYINTISCFGIILGGTIRGTSYYLTREQIFFIFKLYHENQRRQILKKENEARLSLRKAFLK